MLISFLIFLLTLPNLLNYYEKEKSDWKSVGIYLTEMTKPEDNIIILGDSPKHLNYYYKGNASYLNPINIEELIAIIENGNNSTANCIWVFISGHSNKFWGRDQENNTNKSLIIETLSKNAVKIDGLYNMNNGSGLYKIL